MITGVLSEHVDGMWPHVEKMIDDACKYRGFEKYSAKHILEWIKERKCQLWVSSNDQEIDAICVTQLINYPNYRTCYFMITTGHNRELWQDGIRIIEDWARENGCRGIEVVCRPGWEKILKDYKKTHVFLEKVI